MTSKGSNTVWHSRPNTLYTNRGSPGPVLRPTDHSLQRGETSEDPNSHPNLPQSKDPVTAGTELVHQPSYHPNSVPRNFVPSYVLNAHNKRVWLSQGIVEPKTTDLAMRSHIPNNHAFSLEELKQAFINEVQSRDPSSSTRDQLSSKEQPDPLEIDLGPSTEAVLGHAPFAPFHPEMYPIVSAYSNLPVKTTSSIVSSNSRSSTFESTASSLSADSLDSDIYMPPLDRIKRQIRYRSYLYICNQCSGSFRSAFHLRQHGINIHRITFCDACCGYISESTSHLRASKTPCKSCIFDSSCNQNMELFKDPIRLLINDGVADYPSPFDTDDTEPALADDIEPTLVGDTTFPIVDLSTVGHWAASDSLPIRPPTMELPSILPDSLPVSEKYQHIVNSTGSRVALENLQESAEPVPLSDMAARDEECSSFSEYETDCEDDETINTIDTYRNDELFTVSKMDAAGLEGLSGKAIDQVLSPMQQALLDRMMAEFWVIFKQENDFFNKDFNSPPIEDQNCDNETPSDPDDMQRQTNTEQSTSADDIKACDKIPPNNPDLKRIRGAQKGKDDSDDDDRNPKRPRRGSYQPKDLEDSLKFACPYRKHNPRKYAVSEWRICALTPQDTVARVKAHLYRHHRIFPCHRCKESFKNPEDVVRHLNEQEGCPLRDTILGDGLTSHVFEKLKSRKKSDKDQSESDRWKEIYKLLFPSELYIPDPYFEPVQENTLQSPDSRELEDYEQFCRQELPRSVRSALEEVIRNQSAPIEDHLRNQLVSIVRDCQEKIFSRYRESRNPSLTGSGRGSTTLIAISPAPEADPTDTGDETAAEMTPGPVSTSLSFLEAPPHHDVISERPLPPIKIPNGPKPTSDSGYGSNLSEIPASSSPHADGSSRNFSFATSVSNGSMPLPDAFEDPMNLGDFFDMEFSLVDSEEVPDEV